MNTAPKALTIIGLAVLVAGCGSPAKSTSTSNASASSSVDGVIPVEVGPDESGADENGEMPSIEVGEAAGDVTCGQPKYGNVLCTVPITNTTDKMGTITTDMAFYNSSDVRVGTDGRYEPYVAPGETYLVQHYGPKKAVRGEVLSVEFSEADQIPAEAQKRYGNFYLPTSNAKVGKCQMQYGDVVCRVTVTNGGPKQGEIDTTVAFYDKDGVRLDSETRYQEKVQPGSVYRQDFYGPKGTQGVKVLELELQPDK